MKEVLISGYYGFGNTGDEAILETLSLEFARADLKVNVLSALQRETQEKYRVKAFHRSKPSEIIKAIKSSDALISGGGSLFQDVTSSTSLYYYLGIVFLALVMRKKVYVYSQGIGPIKKKINQKLFTGIINRSKAISVRDKSSYDELAKLGVKTPSINLTADPVFLLEPAEAGKGEKILELAGVDFDDERPLIGLAVRAWGSGEIASSNFAAVADKIIEIFNARLVFIPFHCPHDLDFAFDIVNKMKNKPFILDKTYIPSEVMSVMGLMHINIGVRLHSLIFSACMGVPMIGISYDPKIDGFLETMGLEAACSYENLQWESIRKAIETINSDRASIIEAISERTKQSRELARRNLEDLLGELGK